uniref:NADH-ubiquinone oxidoreductase chain 6 n=1 Tax=Clupeonella cultriventris TaxID=501719 RepID=E6N1T5_CLUCU|nr:NADH dehydrogenase subunit 6 [Clupeonella cultriventris]WRK83608.1 NADH dehydrogenase subunit 6 [Clupeonella cultriventris]BAJ54361.1 NADH dehydrogenase subunit 6 [Clupeonella cultriventris]
MVFFVSMWLLGFVLGMVGVASNPAPYFAAFGLVLSSGAGCAVLAMFGTPFLALGLFLIYLGGMLVVFGYSAALAADPHPETWGDASVFEHAMFYLALVVGGLLYFGPSWYDLSAGVLSSCKDFLLVRGDAGGVSMLYALGGVLMVLCAWVLLLTLFVVLELTRGLNRGALRAV